MRLKPHKNYLYTPPHACLGQPRKVEFRAYAGDGRCHITDTDGPGEVYKIVPRFRLTELEPRIAAPRQSQLELI